MSDFKTLQEAYINIYKENIDTEEGKEHTQELITQLLDLLSKGATMASFLYKSKGLGETSLYNVTLNVDYAKAKKEDHEKLEAYTPENEDEQNAKDYLLNLYNNPKPRTVNQTNAFTQYGKGVKVSNTNGKLYLYGYRNTKSVQANPTQKADTRGNMKKACDALKYKLGFVTEKLRDFILDPNHISGLKLKGDLIEFQQDDQGESTGS